MHLLQQRAASQYRHLFYYDESRFTLVSNVPRAWQAPGPARALPTPRGPGVTGAGFLRHDGTELHAYATTQRVRSADVITFFDDFCQHLTQPTIVVLDNASTHRSALFQARIPDWEAQGLTLFFLPPYSPELNRIELLWRCCKPQWLPFKAYRSIHALTHHLRETLKQVGAK